MRFVVAQKCLGTMAESLTDKLGITSYKNRRLCTRMGRASKTEGKILLNEDGVYPFMHIANNHQ